MQNKTQIWKTQVKCKKERSNYSQKKLANVIFEIKTNKCRQKNKTKTNEHYSYPTENSGRKLRVDERSESERGGSALVKFALVADAPRAAYLIDAC